METKASVDMNADRDVEGDASSSSAEGDGSPMRVVSQMEAQIVSLKAELAMALRAGLAVAERANTVCARLFLYQILRLNVLAESAQLERVSFKQFVDCIWG